MGRRLYAIAAVLAAVLALSTVALAAGGGDPHLAGQWHLDFATGAVGGGDAAFDTSGRAGDLSCPTPGCMTISSGGRFNSHLDASSATPLRYAGGVRAPSEVTLLAWIRRTGAPTKDEVIAAQAADSTSCDLPAYRLGYANALSSLQFSVDMGGTIVSSEPVSTPQAWDGAWHMVAGTFDDSRVTLYLDGSQVGSPTTKPGAAITYLSQDGAFGVDGFTGNPSGCQQRDFTGGIDEVQVYDRALGSSEIASLADPLATTPPVAQPPPPAQTLTVSTSGPGSVTSSPEGINCGSDCTEDLPDGSTITLTATPDAGAGFSGWGGACAGTSGSTCTVAMDTAKSVSAAFVPPKVLTVAKRGSGSGTVTSSPAGVDCGSHCTQGFTPGTTVTLTANPAPGSTFTGWGDDCLASTGNTCTLTMDADKSTVANFVIGSAPLTIQLARPFATGKAVVLTAMVNGAPADRLSGLPILQLRWNFSTTGKTITSPRRLSGMPASIRVRPSVIGTGNVRVTAVLSTHSETAKRTFFSRKFLNNHTPTDANSKSVATALTKVKGGLVFAVGDPRVLTGQTTACGPVIVYAGSLKLDGCFLPIETVNGIPTSERFALTPLAKAFGLSRSNAGLMNKMISLTDGYKARGRVVANNHWPLDTHGSARMLAYPQAKLITSSNTTFRLVRRDIYGPAGHRLTLKIDPTKTSIRPGAGLDLKINTIAGFKVVPRDNSTLLSQSGGLIATSVDLPGYVNRFGAPVRVGIQLPIQPESASANGIKIGPLKDIRFGDVPINGFTIVFNEGSNRWVGSGRACFFGITCLDLLPPYGGIFIQNGNLVARTNRNFGSPGRPLGPGVGLENINAGIGLNPSRLLGGARVGLGGGVVVVDGSVVLAFPSSRTPYFLRRDEVGNNFPAHLYSSPFTNPLIALGADVFLRLPIVGTTRLGGGYALYELGGYAAFGGGVDIKILRIIRITGGVSAEFDVSKGAYNVHGDTRACLVPIPKACGGAVTNVSRGPNNAGGAGACIELGPVHVGGGVQWAHPNKPFYWPLDGCKWSKFKLDIRAKIRAARAGGSYTITVKKGQPSVAVQLNGQGGAPLVRVTGPGGQSLDSTADGFDLSPGGKIRIMRIADPDANFTVVGLQDARPGTYTVSLLPGSVPITGISRASDPPAAKATGKVTGSGAQRVLHYDVKSRPDQKVTFYDVSQGGSGKTIGKPIAGGRGSLRFTPSPGRGLHSVLARFELNGMPAEQLRIARFKPPSPLLARPGGLQVKHAKNGSLSVSWKAVPGATRYEIVVTKTKGGQRLLTTRGRRVTIRGIPKTVSGRVSVRAVAKLRDGATAQKPFRRA